MKVRETSVSENENIVQLDESHVAVGRRLPDTFQESYNPLTEDDEGRIANFILFEGRGERPTLESGGNGLAGLMRIAEEHGIDTDECSPGEVISLLAANAEKCGIMISPIYKMEHGLVDFQSSAFGDKWDSGISGIAWAAKADYERMGVDPARFQSDVDRLLEDYSGWRNNGCWELFAAEAEIDGNGVLLSDIDDLESVDGDIQIFYDTWEMEKRLSEMPDEWRQAQTKPQKM